MAIIDEFTVNILVNGQPCKEYGGGAESGGGPKKITKYIEAISDAPYNISLEVSPSFEFTTTAIVLKISIDGYLVHQCCVRPDDRGIRHTISEIPGGAGYHSFSFIGIKRTKGEDPLDPYISDDRLKRTGAILVEFYRYDVPEQTPTRMRAQPSYFKVLQAQRKIPGKKLEELGLSLTHSTRFVELRSSDDYKGLRGSQLDKFPLAAFEFKYYSSRTLQALLSILTPFPIRSKPSVEELLNVTKIQEPNIALPIRPSTHPLQKPSMEEPLNITKIQDPNIQQNQDVSIKEGPNTAVAGRRKREHRDEGESEEQMGKSRKRSKAFKPSNPRGEDDNGGRTKTQGHPHPRNPRTNTHRKTGT